MNRLASSSSPYLRQHAQNPVDWYPWGDEAFARARTEDKPVFLSVGYSSCHWCHVMAHESFEHEEVAAQLNRDFICVKVDREEHPDIDTLYMTATQLVTRRGGWPNSVWLTPDGRPWYAGTYFPREDQPGRMGFTSLLARLVEVWRTRRPEVEQQADQLLAAIRENQAAGVPTSDPAEPPADALRHTVDRFSSRYDDQHGGFGHAPKFPPHSALLLLMRLHDREPSPRLAAMIRGTLDAMTRGGIHDQLAGGFHRYATDEAWLLPHFEKMLYDNALLLKAYAFGFERFGDPAYRRTALAIAGWLEREMTHDAGGFFAALDADSEGEEGRFYTWHHDEIAAALDPDTFARFRDLYGILPGGNFEDEATGRPTGRNILHLPAASDESVIAAFAEARASLLAARAQRVRPGLDDKVITAWNGLMISSLATAGSLLDAPDLIRMAVRARKFIGDHLIVDGALMRCWNGATPTIDGLLEDHAALALADLDLHDATGEQAYRTSAIEVTRRMAACFLDPGTGELFMTPHVRRDVLVRLTDIYDQGSPSGAGLAIQAMIRTAKLENDDTLLGQARALLNRYRDAVQRMAGAASTLAEAVCLLPAASGTPDTALTHDETIRFAADGTARFRFSLTLPKGWKLQESGEAPPVRVTIPDKDCALLSVNRVGNKDMTWEVALARTADSPVSPVISVVLAWRACSEAACLPEETRRLGLAVKTGGPAAS